MKKLVLKFQAVILSLGLVVSAFGGGTAAQNVKFRLDNLFSISEATAANVFFDDEELRFRVNAENPCKEELNVNLAMRITDKSGAELWSGNRELLVAPYGKLAKSIVIDDVKLPYGMYGLNATVSGDLFVTFTETLEFAVAVGNYAVNDKASVQFHLGTRQGLEDMEKNIRLAEMGGFGGNRDDVRWYSTEAVAGRLELPEWRRAVIDRNLDSRQNSPIYSLGLEHTVYTGGIFPHEYDPEICANHKNCKDNPYTLEEQAERFGEFCGYMAQQLKGTSPVFEIGNEPEYYRSKPDLADKYFNFTGQQYALFLKSAYTAIKAVDKNTTVISAGTCAVANENTKSFVEEMLSVEGITQYMDGFGFHPYAYTDAYTDEITEAQAAFYPQIDYIKEKLSEACLRDGKEEEITLWATESGSHIEDDDDKQAAINVRTMVMARTEPLIKKMSIYNLVSKGTDLTEQENQYGIVKHNYTSVKSAYLALSHMNKRLGGAEYKDGIFKRSYGDYRKFSAYGFKKESELEKQYTYVIWEHTGKNSVLTIKRNKEADLETIVSGQSAFDDPTVTVASNAEVKVYDMLGNELAEADTYDLSCEPLYVVATVKSGKTSGMVKTGRTVSVYGTADAPGERVSLIAVREDTLMPAYVALAQGYADNESEYSFSFMLPSEEAKYSVYVFGGSASAYIDGNSDIINIKTQLYINGEQAESLENIRDGENIGLKISMKNLKTDKKSLKFYGAIYGKSGQLIAVDGNDIQWDADTGSADVLLKSARADDIEKVKAFLWNGQLKPYTLWLDMEK